MEKKPILILGATSSIAQASAAAFARRGYPLYLAARDQEELTRIATDLSIRYEIPIFCGYFDAEAISVHQAFFTKVLTETQGLSGVVQVFGYLSATAPGKQQEEDLKTITINFTGAVSLLNLCADYFAQQQTGFIIGVSSVAGDRGRQSNYIYGAAKGALSLYLQGLRNKLYSQNVRVITIKPGFVDTRMMFGRPGIFLAASPDYIGERIARSIKTQRDIIYLPGFWRYIMLIIKLIPEKIFKRLNL